MTTGKAKTIKFRIHAIRLDIPGGHKLSYWHDLPLMVMHNHKPTGSLNFICETSRNSRAKMIVGTKEKGSPIMHDQRMGVLRDYPRNLWCVR